MKRFLFIFTILLVTSAYASAEDLDAQDGQAVVTECGTVHEISGDATLDEAIDALDYYTKKDCILA